MGETTVSDGRVNGEGYWIGAVRDSHKEWVWLSGEPMRKSTVDEWDNYGDDCAAFYYVSGSLSIEDDACEGIRPGYICQFHSSFPGRE